MSKTRDLVVQDRNKPAVPGFNSEAGFELIQRQAKLLAASSLVPATYRNNVPNSAIALNMAVRMNADPLMIMQNLYVVHGSPGWSSQFLIATFNMSGRFSALRYTWVGEQDKDSWGCQAWAVEKGTNEVLRGSIVTIAIAKAEGWHGKSGSKWKTMPQQMLMYRAAAWFIRAYAPEIAMGLHTAEEIQDIVDLDPSQYTIEDALVDVAQEIEQFANAEIIDVIDVDALPEEEQQEEPPAEPEAEAPPAGPVPFDAPIPEPPVEKPKTKPAKNQAKPIKLDF